MQDAKFWLTILSAMPILTFAMQQPPTITDMPKHIIRNITSFIAKKKYRDSLKSTCRYLNSSVTQENKIISIVCYRRLGSKPETAKQFLDKVFTCIQHIVAREGNNPIDICMGEPLDDDMNALVTFLAQCSQPHIAQHIILLSIFKNRLTFLPKEIAGLTQLKELHLSDCSLGLKDLVMLEKIINKSLTKLEKLDVSYNDSITIHSVFQTIAHCKLKSISILCDKEEHYAYVPTEQELTECLAEQIVI